MERCNTTHILLRTWFTLNEINNQIATTVQKRLKFYPCFEKR